MYDLDKDLVPAIALSEGFKRGVSVLEKNHGILALGLAVRRQRTRKRREEPRARVL